MDDISKNRSSFFVRKPATIKKKKQKKKRGCRIPKIDCTESLVEIGLTKLYPFLIKVISNRAIPQIMKRTRNSNLHVVVDNWRPDENILKMMLYLNEIEYLKRSQKLSLDTSEGMK